MKLATMFGIGEDARLRDTVELLLEDARKASRRQREKLREPFFSPVRLCFDDYEEQTFTAFTRDISSKGIGLLHCMKIMPGELTVIARMRDGHEIRLRTDIAWCLNCGEGWYISGGEFVGVATSEES